jgi:hypothetical protein
MSIKTPATGSDHCRVLRLHMWRGNDFATIDSLALPGEDAP